MAFTLSPFFSTSEGCLTRLVQLRLLTCTRPSMPSSISMNAPKSVRLRTLPSTVEPTGILLVQRLPRIRLQLLQAERNAALVRIHVQHHGFHLVANVDDLRGMLHPLRPSHLADVDQAFDALLQLDERAVVGHADHAALHARADRVALGGVQPRVGRQLLEAQRNPLLVAGRTSEPSPGSGRRPGPGRADGSGGPSDISVICSRPSMPPRSTNAP